MVPASGGSWAFTMRSWTEGGSSQRGIWARPSRSPNKAMAASGTRASQLRMACLSRTVCSRCLSLLSCNGGRYDLRFKVLKKVLLCLAVE